MEISPRYDGPPVLQVEAVGPEVGALLVQQRARLGDVLAELAPARWAGPTRCEGWTVQDVVAHLATVTQFFTYSLSAGFGGEPSRVLVGFDPVATPNDLVTAERGRSPEEVLERYRGACADLAEVVLPADAEAWARPAEAPPGHVAASAVALHALWDSWVHERDILLPVGEDPVVDEQEVAASLRYTAALGPAFRATAGRPATGVVGLQAPDLDLALTVSLGETVVVSDRTPPPAAPTISGDGVALLEALSRRAPFPAGAPTEAVEGLAGLDAVFDQVG